MTQKEKLQVLLNKIKGGKILVAEDVLKAFSENGFIDTLYLDVSKANNGSLDAAHSLHNAVFGGINQFSIVTDPTLIKATVAYWPKGLSGSEEYYGEGWHEDNPARAWLIATINALISECEQ